jgi:hypothetical protein
MKTAELERSDVSHLECGLAARHERSYRFRRPVSSRLPRNTQKHPLFGTRWPCQHTTATRLPKAAASRAALQIHPRTSTAPFGVRSRSETRAQLPLSQASRLPAATPVWMSLVSALVVSPLLTSCLKFGEELEFFAPDVTAAHLKTIETRTGTKLPEGSVGIALYSNATSIDPWMQAKIRIPSDAVQGFKTKELKSATSDLAIVIADFRPWWKSRHLIKIAEGDFHTESAFVQWTLGTENGDQVLYIHWMVI